MLDMDFSSGKTGKDDVAVDHQFFGFAGHSAHSEQNGPFAFVHDPFRFQSLVSAMIQDRQIECVGIVDDMAHELMILNAFAVIRKGDGSGGFQGTDRRHFLAFEVLGHGAAGEDFDHTFAFRVCQDIVDGSGIIRRGRGVRHCDDGGESARRSRESPGMNGFRLRFARMTQMNMKIDESRSYDFSGKIDALRIGRHPHRIGDLAVQHADIGDCIKIL